MKTLIQLFTIALIGTLTSCSTMSKPFAALKKIPKPHLPNIPKLHAPKLPSIKRSNLVRFSWRDLLPSSVPIVEPKKDELKKFQLGKEKALAYKGQEHSIAAFDVPVEFSAPLTEPLPPDGEYSLLPPKPE